MFLLRNKKNHLSIILSTPSYLECYRFFNDICTTVATTSVNVFTFGQLISKGSQHYVGQVSGGGLYLRKRL